MFNSRRAVTSGTAGMNASAVTKSSRYGEHINVDYIPSRVSHHTDPLAHQKLDARAAGRSHGYRVPWVSKYCRSPGTRETPLQISPKSIAGHFIYYHLFLWYPEHKRQITSQTKTGQPSELEVVNWQSSGWLMTAFLVLLDASHVWVSPDATPRFRYHALFPAGTGSLQSELNRGNTQIIIELPGTIAHVTDISSASMNEEEISPTTLTVGMMFIVQRCARVVVWFKTTAVPNIFVSMLFIAIHYHILYYQSFLFTSFHFCDSFLTSHL
jgi:hypothetical protein